MGTEGLVARWATFDCYGTLIDWNTGIRGELARLFEDEVDRLLVRYHEIEPRIQTERRDARYREVMAATLSELAVEAGVRLSEDERDALARSLPDWPVFADVPAELAEVHRRGWRLVALSNTDRDFIEASLAAIGVPFEGAIVASEIGSYKPAHGHWRAFAERYAPGRRSTSTLRRATSTTSPRPTSSAYRRCGSTAWARRGAPRIHRGQTQRPSGHVLSGQPQGRHEQFLIRNSDSAGRPSLTRQRGTARCRW